MRAMNITYELENVTPEEYEEYIKELDLQGFWTVDGTEHETWEASPGYRGDMIRVIFKND